MMLRSDLREVWSARIVDYRQSGLSMREWCERNDITKSQLRYWLRRLMPKIESTTGWAPLEIVEDTGEKGDASGGCVTVCVGAARIEVVAGFDSSLLSDVLKVVVAVC